MPKKDVKKRAIGIPENIYKEIENYALNQQPNLFLYEVLIEAWNALKQLKSLPNRSTTPSNTSKNSHL